MNKTLKSLVAAAVTAVALMITEPAHAGFDFGTFTNSVTAAGNGVTNGVSTAASQSFPLHPGAPLLLSPKFAGTGTSTNITGLDLFNGTDWSTIQPILITNSAAGAGTNVVGAQVIPASQLHGAQAMRWDYEYSYGTNNPVGVEYSQFY